MLYVAEKSGALLLELIFFRRERTALGLDLIFYVHNSHHWRFEHAKVLCVQISICLPSPTQRVFVRANAKSTVFDVKSFVSPYVPIKI